MVLGLPPEPPRARRQSRTRAHFARPPKEPPARGSARHWERRRPRRTSDAGGTAAAHPTLRGRLSPPHPHAQRGKAALRPRLSHAGGRSRSPARPLALPPEPPPLGLAKLALASFSPPPKIPPRTPNAGQCSLLGAPASSPDKLGAPASLPAKKMLLSSFRRLEAGGLLMRGAAHSPPRPPCAKPPTPPRRREQSPTPGPFSHPRKDPRCGEVLATGSAGVLAG